MNIGKKERQRRLDKSVSLEQKPWSKGVFSNTVIDEKNHSKGASVWGGRGEGGIEK